MSNLKIESSKFSTVFEECRKKLIEAFDPEETIEEKAARFQSFRDEYDKHVKVIGHVKPQRWTMKCEQGFETPSTLFYEINIKLASSAKRKYEPYILVKKSTIGTDSNGNIEDAIKYRQSGFGVFAAKDFNEREYIGPYLGDVKQKEQMVDIEENPGQSKRKSERQKKNSETYTSSYSLDIGDAYNVDGNGSTWNHWYFGLHLMNDPKDRSKINITVDGNLRFFAKKPIKVGEELFLAYGPSFWRRMENEI